VLSSALESVRTSRGCVIVVEGSAGTGKSALLRAGSELASASAIRVISARGGELEQDYPFGVIRQLHEPALRAAPPSERARRLAGAAAPAARVLGMAEGEIGAYAAGFAAMHALYWLTAELAAERPLLVTVDDAHWADSSSLRALDYLARRIADLPVVLIAAFRPDEPGAQMALLVELRGAAAARVCPAALRPESVARLVRDRIPEAGQELCEACYGATAGNPLLQWGSRFRHHPRRNLDDLIA
jgi:predicted ATPase